jgi:hypothetical protein
MPADIPPATLAAADHADPDWWEECAAWHEAEVVGYALVAHLRTSRESITHHSAAALACRAFALMMRRAAVNGLGKARWVVDDCGNAVALSDWPDGPRSLPQAVADALQEEG